MTLQLAHKLQALIIGVVAALIAGFAFLPSIASAAETAEATGGSTTPAVPYVPTVIKPGNGYQTLESKPLITGVTLNDTEVAVYIDGQFNGKATVTNSDSGTANWYYYPFLDLKPGVHTLQVRAENPASGLRSEASVKQWFKIVEPTPAPTLIEAVVNEETEWDKPWITGLSHEGLEVAVFVDGTFNGYAELGNDKEYSDEEMAKAAGMSDSREVMSFKYQPFVGLTEGWHTAYATARDETGKVSVRSNEVRFFVDNPATVSAATATASDNETETTTEEDEDTSPDVGGPAVEDSADDSSDTSDDAEADAEGEVEGDDANDEDTEVYIDGEGEEDDAESGSSSDEEGDDEADEEGTSRSTIIGWIILALVAIGLVYKGRKGMKSFFNEPELTSVDSGSKGPDSSKLMSDKKDGDKGGKEKGDKDKSIPPPPPPASSF